MSKIAETELYAPVKTYLEGQGYEVKGEVGAVDVMAVRGGDDPVIVELKTSISLTLFHQAVARQSITDDVYICIPRGKGKPFLKALKANVSLCRRLGIGMITVRMKDSFVEVHCDPAPYRPVKNKRRKGRLLREFARRVGDPNKGGQTRIGLVTAYRQDALRCAVFLAGEGPSKGSVVAGHTGVASATRIMAADHYGWFERVSKGVYALTSKGDEELDLFPVPAPVKVNKPSD